MTSRVEPSPKAGPARRYRFGFSGVGLIAVLLPMLPNVAWVLLPPVSSSLPANRSALAFVDLTGTVAQVVMIGLLVVVVTHRRRTGVVPTIALTVGGACLVGYLALWVLYFTFPVTPTLLLAMAVLPSIYFLCLAFFLENYAALVAASLFTLIHVTVTATSYY